MSEVVIGNTFSPIENIPTDWSWAKFGVHFLESDERNGAVPPGPLLSVSEYRGVEINTRTKGQKASEDVSHYRVVRPGQLAVNTMWLNHGGLGVSSLTGYISPAYKAFNISPAYEPRYIHHLLRCSLIINYFKAIGAGVRPNAQMVTGTVLGMTRLPLPPRPIQKRIADYLDRETGEIDAMLAKMDELTETLEARKSDVIQQETVGRGSPMSRIKFYADVSLGKTVQGTQKNEDESFVNYVRAASIQRHGLKLDDQRMWMSDSELEKYDLRQNDVLVVEGGAGYGRSVTLRADMPGWGFQNHVIRIRPIRATDGRFLDYCIKAHFSGGLIDILVDGATIPALSSEKARELTVPQVPAHEQTRIADHLDEVTGKIDQMLAKTAELKSLLIERRSALITDVVTGKKQVHS